MSRKVLTVLLLTVLGFLMVTSVFDHEMKVYATVNVFNIVGIYDLGDGKIQVNVEVQFCDACNPNSGGNPGCEPFTHGYPPPYYPYYHSCGVVDGRYVAVLLRNGSAQTGILVAGPLKIICTPSNCPLEPTPPTVLTFIFTGVPVGAGQNVTAEADVYCNWCGHWFPTPETMRVLAPPVASFTYTYKDRYEDHIVNFDASASHDPDGNVVQYDWDFGDGKTGAGKITMHTYEKSNYPNNEYSVKLIVTDNDGLKNDITKKVVIGNLIAEYVGAVQAPVGGVDLVHNKPTTFEIHYVSTFDEDIDNVQVRIDLEGFSKVTPHTFRATFRRNGFHYFYLHDVDPSAGPSEFLPRSKPTVKYRITIDWSNSIKESFEDDNVWPRDGLWSHNVKDTRSIKILFVRVHHQDEPVARRVTSVQASTYMGEAMLFLGSTYPLAYGSEVLYELSPTPLIIPNGTNWRGALERLRERALTGIWPFRSYAYDRVVGVVGSWNSWFAVLDAQLATASGFTTMNGRSVMVKTLFDGSVAHEIGHTYGLGDDYPGGRLGEGTDICRAWSGYWVVLRRERRDRPTFMHSGQPNRWVDNTDYNVLLNKFDTGDPEVLLLSGLIFNNNTATFVGPQYRVSEGVEDMIEGGAGDYYIVLLDAFGQALSRVGFNATFFVLGEPPFEVDEYYFSFAIRWVNETRMIQLQDALGNVLATRNVSLSPPSVVVISPNGGEVFTPATNYTITWSALDPDGDQLTYNVLVSEGINSTAVPIATGLNQTSFTYDFTNLPPGNQYLIYVIASDGVNVGGDVSDGFFTIEGPWWPMFHHDLTHTGYSASTAPNTNETLRSYKVGGYVWSSPAVADDRLFVGSGDGKIYALNATTGRQLWSYTTGSWVESSPAVADGKVYVGSHDGKIYALDTATGAHMWNYTTGNWVYSSPAVSDGRVYVGSHDGKIYALNSTTGAYIWSYTTGGRVESSPAVADGIVYIGSYDYKVYALNASNGAPIWNYTTQGIVESSPAVVYGKVFIGSWDGKVYALNATTGAYLWSYKTGRWVSSSPAVADGRLFVGSGDDKVYALNATNGAYIWSYTTSDSVWSSPAVADGKVFIGSWDGNVYALNEATGAYVWSYKTEGWVSSSPAVADGKVFIGSWDGNVYAFGAPGVPPAELHDVAVTSVRAFPTSVLRGQSAHAYAIVENQGYYTETFNVTVYVGATAVATQNVILIGGSSHAVTSTWNTGGLPAGDYEIRAEVSIVPGETDTVDNKLTDGTITIIEWTGAILYIDPPVTYGRVGESIKVNITIANVIDLYAWQGGLNYDPTILNFTSVSFLGPFTGIGPSSYPPPGVILIGASMRGWVPGFTGSTVLATLTFEVIAQGSSDIIFRRAPEFSFWETYLLDSATEPREGNKIPFASLNGYVTTEAGTHDVAIKNVSFSGRTIVGQGYRMPISVTVENQGIYTETFDVTLYADTKIIQTKTVTLTNGNSTTITFTWDTTGLPKGNYTISGYATPVPYETDKADNTYTDGTVRIAMIGDITGPTAGVPDGKVDIRDLAYIAKLYGVIYPDPRYNPNCDLTGPTVGLADGKIDIRDLATAAKHYGEIDP